MKKENHESTKTRKHEKETDRPAFRFVFSCFRIFAILLFSAALCRGQTWAPGTCGPGGCGPSAGGSIFGGWQGASVGTFGRAQICPPQGGSVILRGGIGGAGAAMGGVYAAPQQASEVNPAVVIVRSRLGDPERAVASGFVVNVRRDLGSRGLVATAAHQVAGAMDYTLVFTDGATTAGKLVTADAVSDVALIEFVDPHASWFKLMLAARPAAQKESATWTGYLFGPGPGEGTQRQISGQCMVVGYRGIRMLLSGNLFDEGQSGGPVLDSQGQVIGLVCGRSEQEGYCAHVDQIRRLICEHAPWALPDCCPEAKQEATEIAAPEFPLPVEPNGNVVNADARLVVIEKRLTTIESRMTTIERLPLPAKGDKGDKGEKGDRGPGLDEAGVRAIVARELARPAVQSPTSILDPQPSTPNPHPSTLTPQPVYWDIVPRRAATR